MLRFLISLVLLLGGMPVAVQAATCTWTGAGIDGNWSHAGNWDNCAGAHAKPTNGDIVVFPQGAPQPYNTNNLTGLALRQIKLNGSNYSIDGNAVTLTNGVSANAPTSGTDLGPHFNTDITLKTNAQTFQNNGELPMLLGGKLNLNGLALTINGTANTNLAGAISGAGTITKNGSATLFLESSSNAFTGTVTINNGTVEATSDTSLGATGSGNGTIVNSGATLLIEFDATSTEPVRLAGFGYNNAGALAGGFTQNHANAGITLTADASIDVFSSGTSLTVGGVIGGAFTLYKTGLGILRLNNTNTYPQTVVSAGTLEVNGSIKTVTVDSGGILAGNGAFGTLSMQSAGILAPGAGGGAQPGTLHGHTVDWLGAVMKFRLGSSSALSDHLALTANLVNSGGATHAFHFVDGDTPPVSGMPYTLITFAASTLAASDFSFTYTGTGPGATMSGTFTLGPTSLVFTPGTVVSDLIFRDGFN
jgi:autotransporter-associated beta strand protein